MRVERQLAFWLAALAALVVSLAALKEILLPFVAAIVIAYFLTPSPTGSRRTGSAACGRQRSSSA